VIPAHDDATGCLPPGRYLTSVEEIAERFVLHDDFEGSATRARNWVGLNAYLTAWDEAEAEVGSRVLIGIWIAGSFVTKEPNPSDIDLTPIYDRAVVASLAGKPGVGKIRLLLGDRDRLKRYFYVESFPVGWRSVGSSLFPEKLPSDEQQYLLAAGGLTDFWQREKRSDPDGGPLPSERYAYKGFLEVLR
jgi:hypothetical protein